MSHLSLNLVPEPISRATEDAFAPYPWCLTLFRDPDFIPVQTFHQQLRTTATPSGWMSATIRSCDAVRAVQSLYRLQPDDTASAATNTITTTTAVVAPGSNPSPNSSSSSSPSSDSDHHANRLELRTFYSLGKGASGMPSISHGGLIATLLDQQAGSLGIADPTMPRPLTVYINIKYLRPVPVPGAVQVRSFKARVEGRKHWITVEMTDGEGVMLASAESLFVNGKPRTGGKL